MPGGMAGNKAMDGTIFGSSMLIVWVHSEPVILEESF